jgi:hypothetical protein
MQNRLAYKGDWSFSVRKDFVLNPNISIGAKMLYIALRSFCAPDGDTAFPSSKTLAASLGVSRETVFKYAQELERLGLLERTQQQEGGRFTHTLYTLFDTDSPCRKKPCTEKPVAEKSDTKSTHINSTYIREDVPEEEEGSPSWKELKECWNAHSGLRKILSINRDRRKALCARRKEKFWRENWQAAIDRASKSSFCRGANQSGWVIDVDFFLKDGCVAKILEGKYDDRAPKVPRAAEGNF